MNWGWAHKAADLEPGEDILAGRHEAGETKGEEVGGVSWAGEGVSGDLELLTAY